MALKLFTDLIDALGKVAGGLKAIVNLPRAERDALRGTLDETYRLIDITLNMVIIRLGDILLHANDDDFLRETAQLDNFSDWTQTERAFRLCRSLRVALRETQTLAGKLAGAMSTSDWNALLQQLQSILASEGEVANFIGQQFHQHANDARSAYLQMQKTTGIRDSLAEFRAALIAERQKLIKQELELYTMI
jgi:hypothetical protein